MSDYVRVDQEDETVVLRARDEIGRGKRFGMSGELTLDEREAERFAKWVFARDFAP